ncbi:phospholipase D family protein [Sinirhodobacter sp. HNIBRBA609]|nr:phospholipase D family protein [Sinirhodobacter sp. HNIBRBA609]
MGFVRVLLWIVIVVAVGVVVMRWAFPLPPRDEDAVSRAIPLSDQTPLGAQMSALAADHPGMDGVAPLGAGEAAFATRVALVRQARESIDVQYYIWQTDTTGWMLLDELRQASERGVRVRLLLDDNGVPGLDAALAALDAQPNVEVRLFNPFTFRSPKILNYVFAFSRLNHRMHNKSMTFDGAATIVGGRNIGDIYFAFGEETQFIDLDVLAVGPIVGEVQASFDAYWASASAYPAAAILPPAPEGLAGLQAQGAHARESLMGSNYVQAIEASPTVQGLLSETPDLEWTTIQMVADDPIKALGNAPPEALLINQLPKLLNHPEVSLDLVSAYFIPGKKGAELLGSLARKGVKTRVLTNALESTDVSLVHSAYMKYRPALLEAGVRVLELRAEPDVERQKSVEHLLHSSASSLHAKTFGIDGKRVFVGSFNFDPRSAALNTEMGFVIDSPRLARGLSDELDQTRAAYEVTQAPDGTLQWAPLDGVGPSHTTEPGVGPIKRWLMVALQYLPLEWML